MPEAAEVQEKYLARDYAGAGAAVPFEFIDRTSLIGPRERVQERLHAYADAGVTTLTIATPTGEGLTSAKSFTRARRCVLHGDLRIV